MLEAKLTNTKVMRYKKRNNKNINPQQAVLNAARSFVSLTTGFGGKTAHLELDRFV
jgi:hypothetical protein